MSGTDSLSLSGRFEPLRAVLEGVRLRLGLDRAVTFTVLGRAWISGAGLITVALIVRFLSPAQQGYYYTFSSLIALQMVFELGFSQVVMQLASHERAHVSILEDGTVSGDEAALSRLASVCQMSVRWYALGALLLAVVLIPSGLYFFSTHQGPGEIVFWRIPWIAVAIASVLLFQINPLYSFLEGCGFVSDVAHARCVQAVVGSLLAWASLTTNRGLYAPAALISGQVLTAAIWLLGKRRLLYRLLTHETAEERVSWREEVWPFQWRIAISWIAGYFIFQTFNPFLFAYKGPAAAGQMGISVSCANSLMMAALAWISTKAAPFGTMIAQKQYSALDKLFFTALRQSILVAGMGLLVVWSATTYLYSVHSKYAQKLLSPLPFALLLIAFVLNHVCTAMATYLRAHKQEKFFQLSSSIAIAVLLSNYYFARTSGALGMVVGYLAIIGLLGVGGGALIFNRYRRLWHCHAPDTEGQWASQ